MEAVKVKLAGSIATINAILPAIIFFGCKNLVYAIKYL